MPQVIEQEIPVIIPQRQAEDAEAEAIEQRLAQFRATMALVEAKAPRQQGTSPTPQQIREMAYEEREAGLG